MIYNAYIAVPFAVWAITQLTKFTISAYRGNLDLRNLYASGGMPSVHSAVVCSLVTTALVLDGLGSHLFGFTAVFAAIIIYDSLGVRRSSGEQGAALNMILTSLSRDRQALIEPDLRLREVLGHKPKEVVVGGVTGILLALVLNYQNITPLTNFLAATPIKLEMLIYAIIGAAVIVTGLVTAFLLRRRRSAVLVALGRRILGSALAVGIVLLAVAGCEFEKVSYLAWRFWPLATLLGLVSLAIQITLSSRRRLPELLAGEAEIQRKAKWLPGQKRKRKKGRA